MPPGIVLERRSRCHDWCDTIPSDLYPFCPNIPAVGAVFRNNKMVNAIKIKAYNDQKLRSRNLLNVPSLHRLSRLESVCPRPKPEPQAYQAGLTKSVSTRLAVGSALVSSRLLSRDAATLCEARHCLSSCSASAAFMIVGTKLRMTTALSGLGVPLWTLVGGHNGSFSSTEIIRLGPRTSLQILQGTSRTTGGTSVNPSDEICNAKASAAYSLLATHSPHGLIRSVFIPQSSSSSHSLSSRMSKVTAASTRIVPLSRTHATRKSLFNALCES